MIWSAQFLSAIGFSFGLPFISYLMQEDMGVTDKAELAYWVAAFSAACPLTMMFFSPVWGALGDRYGRRKMLLRSYIGGALAVGLISVAQTPLQLVMLRVIQGAFCGTMSASQALISTQTPREHTGFALGALNSAMFSGTIAGAFAGDGVPGKVQLGPAWWYCDHLEGMRDHFEKAAAYGVLSQFIGMTTDSRSLLSFVRHEYFRRAFCGWLGEKAERGEMPDDFEILSGLVRAVCYENAKTYIGVQL